MKQSAGKILELLSEFIGVNTLFVAINDGQTNFILKALNRSETLVIEGTSASFGQSYCQLVGANGSDVFVIPSTLDNPMTADLDVTTQIGDASFFGAAIVLRDGTVAGTICGLDRSPVVFKPRELELLKTMASFLSYVIELENAAFRDKLTSTFNRNFAMQYLESRESRRHQTAALIFIDIDNFKTVNDTYGHRIGDEVLIETARRIHKQSRGTDVLCRLGGDEFLAIIWDYGSQAVVNRILSDIMAAFAPPFQLGKAMIKISVSVGASLYPEHGEGLNELLHMADEAMYQVKRSGKNNYRIHHTGVDM